MSPIEYVLALGLLGVILGAYFLDKLRRRIG